MFEISVLEALSKHYSDQEIIAMISRGGSKRDQAISYVYQWEELKRKLGAFVHKRGGSDGDKEDIFHEGIIAFDRNIRLGKFRAETSLQGYLFSICRFIWNNHWRKAQKEVVVGEPREQPDEQTPELSLFAKEKKAKLREVLNLLDDTCRKIITYWKEFYSMEEIAQALSLSSAQMAKKYRYRCMKKLMKALDQKPSMVQDLRS